MNQRIRVLQQLGEEFERAVIPASADRQESRHVPRPRRLTWARVPWVVDVSGWAPSRWRSQSSPQSRLLLGRCC
jgi:hypothetical protein